MFCKKNRSEIGEPITFHSLCQYVETLQYQVLFYGKSYDENLTKCGNLIIIVLEKENYVKNVKAFTYANQDLHLIFIKYGFSQRVILHFY